MLETCESLWYRLTAKLSTIPAEVNACAVKGDLQTDKSDSPRKKQGGEEIAAASLTLLTAFPYGSIHGFMCTPCMIEDSIRSQIKSHSA